MLRKRLFELGLLVALLTGMLFSVGLPVQAQDDPPPEDEVVDPVTVEITGEIFVGEGGVTVDGVKIAPASAFQPSEYEGGECVTVTGVYLNEDVLQATEIVPSENPEVDCPSTGEGEGEGNGNQNQNENQDEDQAQEQEQEMEGCTTGSHPVLEAYASEFGVPYEELEAWHCQNMGLGEIGRALLMAEALDGVSYDEILQKRLDGESWGAIKEFYDIKGGDLAPGRVISGHHEVQGDPIQEGESVGPGNSENAPGQSAENPGHGGTPPGQDKDKDKSKDKDKDKENPGQGGGKKK